MKYLCLGYFDQKEMDSRPKAEIDAIMRQCGPHMDALYQTRRVLVDAGLGIETKRMRRVKGQVVITDGPFAKSKEMIGGVFLIEAEDFDDAVRIAGLHPTTQMAAGEGLGWRLEIRPIHYFKEF